MRLRLTPTLYVWSRDTMNATRAGALLSITASLAIATGCAALRDPYPESTSPDAATLIITRVGKHNMQVYGFKDSSNCTGSMNFGGTQRMVPGEERTVKLDPGKESAISFHTYIGYGNCDLIVSFVPAAGKTYRATLDSDEKQCYVSLVRREGASEVREPTFRKRIFTRPLTESGSFCRS